MKILYTFLLLMVTAFLFLLPVGPGVYNFLTSTKTDSTFVTTAGVTTANVTLKKPLYNDDPATVSFFSDLASDIPQVVGYHTTTHVLDITGLTASSNRTLETTYDTSAFGTGVTQNAFITLFTYVPWLWYAMLSVLPIIAIIVLWKR